ncbi:heme exporter protein CcmD [Paraglaciecola aquimarina]|uniref:Heme exporter protein D n=1 Tax=Paraglaciecola aquimarina TaxID=1235557 RepID=A0ABU3T1J2_9ALTE|nr:heme exporter protein CcmD [Paraglaciecola aquimarina]MDU0356134.1 heme exporter protein CcmD [Paraglaciecola aquimarina]
MHFENINEFWAMSGYGLYVWLSFGLGFLSLIILWLDSIMTKRKLFGEILAEQTRQARIKAAAQKTKLQVPESGESK